MPAISRRHALAAVLGLVLALPLIAVLYYFGPPNPPQCEPGETPPSMTSQCIIGADIGSVPFFIVAVLAIWAGCAWIVNRLLRRRR